MFPFGNFKSLIRLYNIWKIWRNPRTCSHIIYLILIADNNMIEMVCYFVVPKIFAYMVSILPEIRIGNSISQIVVYSGKTPTCESLWDSMASFIPFLQCLCCCCWFWFGPCFFTIDSSFHDISCMLMEVLEGSQTRS